MKTKTNIAISTLKTYYDSRRCFYLFFKESDSVEEITQEQIFKWKSMLLRKLAISTVAGKLKNLRSVFNWAQVEGWITKNPLKEVPIGSFRNPAKDHHVTREEYLSLLEYCPCQEWRTILALVRYGGLRCPSEVLRLRWSDIDLEGRRFHVHSPKTKHHQGKEGRMVPLFVEIEKELLELYAEKKSDDFIFHRYKDRASSNLRTQFHRIREKASVAPFARAFTNMRASRSIEIYVEFGDFFESQWIGHSYKIAKKHYLKIRDIDYHRAANWQENKEDEQEQKPSDQNSVQKKDEGGESVEISK